jgi:cullin-associated NEDD8-dissociated protein 1
MRAQGVWNDVVVMSVSDFGRTITSNGQGTDHAWSGNHFIMGGGVKGKKILGKYPRGLRESDELNIGRGRIIPEIAWEHPWNGILEWFGVAPANMDICLPNRRNFPDLFTQADMFN